MRNSRKIIRLFEFGLTLSPKRFESFLKFLCLSMMVLVAPIYDWMICDIEELVHLSLLKSKLHFLRFIGCRAFIRRANRAVS